MNVRTRRPHRLVGPFIALALLLATPVHAEEPTPPVGSGGLVGVAAGVAKGILLYAPNRLLDALDLVRARVRIGPGYGFGVRATEGADLFLGSYGSVYAGLPGPRGRRIPRLPVGLEARAGIEAGPADLSTGTGMGPDYGVGEFGIGFHAALVGIDVGVDPLELVDLALGFLTLDPRDDDF